MRKRLKSDVVPFIVKDETFRAHVEINHPTLDREPLIVTIERIDGIPKRCTSHINIVRKYRPLYQGIEGMNWMNNRIGINVSIRVSVRGCGLGTLLYRLAYERARDSYFNSAREPITYIHSEWYKGNEFEGSQWNDQFNSFAKFCGVERSEWDNLDDVMFNYKEGGEDEFISEGTIQLDKQLALKAVKASFCYRMYSHWYKVEVRSIYINPQEGVHVFFEVKDE